MLPRNPRLSQPNKLGRVRAEPTDTAVDIMFKSCRSQRLERSGESKDDIYFLAEGLVGSVELIALRSADVGQVRLAYVEAGNGEPVVFVHGIPTDYRAWSGQIEPFADKYHVIAYSRRLAQPNHNSMDYEKSTIENNSADLVGLINELGVAPVHLVGHSYGGFTAAYCASTNPQLIRTLTPIEPAVSTMLQKNRKSASEFLGLLFAHPSIAISAARFQRSSLDPALRAFRQGDFDAALRLNLDGIMNRQGAFEQLPEPVRVMTKENEKTVGEHFPHFEKPQEFNELVLVFLSNHPTNS